jgi:hypothetical protein
MRYIRHWPEVLFVILVMASPFAACWVSRPSTIFGLLVTFVASMVVGLLHWFGFICFVCRSADNESPGQRAP